MTPPSEIVLHHGDGTRSLRVRWVLEELGVSYALRPVLFPPRVRQPEFLQENPVGSLPLMVDGGLRMTESMAICELLVQRHGPSPLAVGPDEAGFATYRQFCWFGEATLMPPIGTLVGSVLMTPPEKRPHDIVAAAREHLARRLPPIEAALASSAYLAAGRFTLADVSVGYALGLATLLGESGSFPHAVSAYVERLAARPAHRRASVPNAAAEAAPRPDPSNAEAR